MQPGAQEKLRHWWSRLTWVLLGSGGTLVSLHSLSVLLLMPCSLYRRIFFTMLKGPMADIVWAALAVLFVQILLSIWQRRIFPLLYQLAVAAIPVGLSVLTFHQGLFYCAFEGTTLPNTLISGPWH